MLFQFLMVAILKFKRAAMSVDESCVSLIFLNKVIYWVIVPSFTLLSHFERFFPYPQDYERSLNSQNSQRPASASSRDFN